MGGAVFDALLAVFLLPPCAYKGELAEHKSLHSVYAI